jgi:CubicO group peptidase (beta-lactamase class C family)
MEEFEHERQKTESGLFGDRRRRHGYGVHRCAVDRDRVVARLSQRSYTDYVQTEILEPLGMTSTAFTLTDAFRPRTATGYNPHPYEDSPTPSMQPHLNGLAAVGQLYSSVHDLSKWLALQFRTATPAREGTQILKGRSIEETHRVHYVAPDWDWGYTLCWVAERHEGRVDSHLILRRK